MNKTLLAAAAAAAFGAFNLEAAPRYCNVSVMQWNLHIAIDMTYRFNIKAQADVINKHNPDVVVLNEVDIRFFSLSFSPAS